MPVSSRLAVDLCWGRALEEPNVTITGLVLALVNENLATSTGLVVNQGVVGVLVMAASQISLLDVREVRVFSPVTWVLVKVTVGTPSNFKWT